MHRISYCLPIVPVLFVLAVLVSYFKPILWRCHHLWPYIRMVHWIRASIMIAMQWVMLRKTLLAFLLPARKMQFSFYISYTSFELAISMWLLTIHCLFRPSPVLPLVAISGIRCAQPTMFPKLQICKEIAPTDFLSCTNFKTGSKLPQFSRIVVSARARQYSTKAPS
jgi:hypothetical protein